MSEWRNYHVYYTNIDRLLLECVAPLLRAPRTSLMCFWERHYAGGPHVRVRFQGEPAELDKVSATFVPAIESYLALHPCDPISDYSSDNARQMLELENEPCEPEDLEYHVNVIRQRPYQRLQSRIGGDKGLELLHEFLRDSNPLAEEIVRNAGARHDSLLRLYFLNALGTHGNIVQGAVSFKSHWSGYAAFFQSRAVIERIRSSFEEQKDKVISAMLEMQDAYSRRKFSDRTPEEWLALLLRFDKKAEEALRSGATINSTMTEDEIRNFRAYLEGNALERSEFMQALVADERFLPAFRNQPGFARNRVLTNLLYMMVPAAGLSVLDKMALCYFTHRAVEIHFQCDLTDVLKNTIANVLKSPSQQ